MAIKIEEIYGYQIFYSAESKSFMVLEKDGTELARAPTQDEVEVKAKELSKQGFKRIRIIEVGQDGVILQGELTSLNKTDQEAWVSMEKTEDSYGSGRQKIRLKYSSRYYEATETNLKILESIKVKREAFEQVRVEITALVETLEKPINLAYFGMEK